MPHHGYIYIYAALSHDRIWTFAIINSKVDEYPLKYLYNFANVIFEMPIKSGNQGMKNANPCTRKVYSWILYGCKGNSMVYLKPLYCRLDRLA